MQFTKAHATGNDFVLLADPAGQMDLDAGFIAASCDRHLGVGADGLIRAVPSHWMAKGRRLLAEHELVSTDEAPVWFMDYYNGDGSVAEMCGNGVRAFVHFLAAEGLAELAEGEELPIMTRAGLRAVRRVPEGYAVGMGVWSFIDPQMAAEQASDSLVKASSQHEPRPALSISMGNPHTVVALPDEASLEQLNLTEAPTVEPLPPHGTNVEFVVPGSPLVQHGVGQVRMRVHERGSGETLSCGTGACAAAAATRVWVADDAVDTWKVAVPGGEVTVSFAAREDGAEEVTLAGPATIVFTGELVP
ncbi:diaminopimelate epimerase [Nesterenkonia populi]|uniref:diaminopimelate epimerase n=1 Tax=Nesterenkonia populi TaxID=1591087 RepID=UPI0011BFD2A7|nr:diaminopimelate epimerase [Nesterenkonia populi]